MKKSCAGRAKMAGEAEVTKILVRTRERKGDHIARGLGGIFHGKRAEQKGAVWGEDTGVIGVLFRDSCMYLTRPKGGSLPLPKPGDCHSLCHQQL